MDPSERHGAGPSQQTAPDKSKTIQSITSRFRPIAPRPTPTPTPTPTFGGLLSFGPPLSPLAVDKRVINSREIEKGKMPEQSWEGGSWHCACQSTVADSLGGNPWSRPEPRGLEVWMTVEYVSETCMFVGRSGNTELEWALHLDKDSYPGFLTDESCRVLWVNDAFREMATMMVKGAGEGRPMEVWLEMKYQIVSWRAFSSLLKMQYRLGKETRSETVPCDAWRMSDGGFVWRMDVDSALTLGRSKN